MGRNTDQDPSVVFVFRAPSLPVRAMVSAAQAIRLAHPSAPTLDVRLRTISCPRPSRGRSLRFAAESAAAAVALTCGTRPWVGLVQSETGDAEAAAIKAERWIDIATKLVAPRILEVSDDALMRRLLEDHAWARELASLLDPLIAYDRGKKLKVVPTLEAALLDVPEQRAVATALGMDRHTVTRHLNQAAKLLGRDIRWGVDRLLVEQALLAHRALKLRARTSRPAP